MLQLQTVLQTLAPTSGIERAGEQLQTVRVREGRKNEFHISPFCSPMMLVSYANVWEGEKPPKGP